MGRRTTAHLFPFIICLLLVITLAVPSAPQSPLAPPLIQPNENIDWVLVIDTSKSMVGAGGAENIFTKVQEVVVNDFIKKANKGDSIAIIAFGDNPPLVIPSAPIISERSKNDLITAVRNLKAEGTKTYTGDAVEAALDRIQDLKAEYKDQNRKAALLLFTDGNEEHDPQKPSKYLEDIPISKIKDTSPYTYIVWLNKKSKPSNELQKFVDKFDRGRIVQYTPSEISNIHDDFVDNILPPQVTIRPTSLDLAEIEPGATYEGTVIVNTTRNTTLKLALNGVKSDEVVLISPSKAINLEAKKDNNVIVQLQLAPNISDGQYNGNLIFMIDEINSQEKENAKIAPFIVGFSFKVARVPILNKLLKYGAITLGLLVVLWFALYFLLGRRSPIQAWRDHLHLEGELVIISQQESRGNESIRLRNVKARKIKLSDIQTGRLKEALGGMDAELKAIHKNGDKLVQIESLQGPLYIQGIEVVTDNLYDGDLIQLGELKLQYRGLVARPEQAAYAE
jgi:hypothetical protein